MPHAALAPALVDPSRRWRRASPLALVGLLALAGCTDPQRSATVDLPDGAPAREATVVSVVDGDTVQLDIGGTTERVRLLGIDTPETVRPDHPVECFGPEASARAKELLPEGETVLVRRDEEARDRFGRLLLYVWRARDGLFVNEALLADGVARTLSIAPNEAYRAQLGRAQAEARAAGTGLWSACPPEP